MNSFQPKGTKHNGPEDKIQTAIIKKLRFFEWFVKSTHGNMYQSGFPDLYAAHRRYGPRWIEVKNPEAFRFTAAQLEIFPMMTAAGVGIWVLTSDHESEFEKLLKPPNWGLYLHGIH